MKYLLMVRSAPEAFELRDQSAAEMQQTFEFMDNLNRELIASGEFVDAAGLAAPNEARTVVKRSGRAVTTDGPFTEAKEVIGGFWILDCASYDRAVEIATRVVDFDGPASPDTIEVRQIVG